MIKKEILPPSRIMKCEGAIENAESLLTPVVKQAHIGAPLKAPLKITGKGFVVLDLGKELRGGIRIITGNSLSSGKNLVPIRVRFGESASECMAEPGEKNAGNDHAVRDISTQIVSFSTAHVGSTGFRFVRLDFFENTDALIYEILSDAEIFELEARYTCKGDDPELERIYSVARRTLDLCCAGDYIWDGIKRDRLVWIGDMHPEMLAFEALYGRHEIIENSLEFLKATTPLERWMCNIATYSAWWVICLADWYEKTGAAEFVRANLDYALKTVSKLLSFVDEEGELRFDCRILVDWPTVGSVDEEAGARAIFILMAKRAAALFKSFSKDTRDAEALLERLEKKPLFVQERMQVAALKFMAVGKLTEDEQGLMKRLGENGLSTFMSYYILTAYAHYFGTDSAVEIMKKYYGGMLRAGATSFWEDFHLDWLEGAGRIDELVPSGLDDLHGDRGDFCYKGFRHSLCHAWSTGIIAFMKENNL